MTMLSSRHRRLLLFRCTALLLSLVIGIGLAETILRLTREAGRFYPYRPNTVRVTYPWPEITRGVSDPAYFSTNTFGCRGPELANQQHRLLVIGGSTAACAVLDDSEAWPQLVMDRVNRHYNRGDFLWVTNSGIDGKNSRHHIMHAKFLVPKIPGLDHVLVYCGFNDVNMWLFQSVFDTHFFDSRANFDETIANSFTLSNYTPEGTPWHKRLEIWKQLSLLKSAFYSRQLANRREQHVIIEDERMEWLKAERERRQKKDIHTVSREKMSTFDASVDAYADNLVTIIRLIREASSEPILMAQAMQFDRLSEKEEREWWLGAMDGGKTYTEMTQLQELVRKYNQRMEQVAKKQNVLFVPLPKLLEGKGDLYYDGIHFHEEGARIVAEVIADFLIKNIYDRATPKPGK